MIQHILQAIGIVGGVFAAFFACAVGCLLAFAAAMRVREWICGPESTWYSSPRDGGGNA